MIDYATWRDLAFAFVRVECRRCGWVIRSVVRARTGTWYVKCEQLGTGVRAAVRLSDHRALGREHQPRTFHVRQAATLRLLELPTWLKSLRPGQT